jgi:hypothetical protein
VIAGVIVAEIKSNGLGKMNCWLKEGLRSLK